MMDNSLAEQLKTLLDDFTGLDCEKQQAAIKELSAIGQPAIPYLLELESEMGYMVWDAVLGMNPDELGEVLPLMSAEDDRGARLIRRVADHKPPLLEAAPYAIAALRSGFRIKRLAALETVFNLHQATVIDQPEFAASLDDAVDDIVHLLADDDWYIRREAAKCIGALKPSAEVAVRPLIEAQPTCQYACACALAVYREDPRVVPALVQSLREKWSAEEWPRVLRPLVYLGEEAIQALPELESLLESTTFEPHRKELRKAIKDLKSISQGPKRKSGQRYLHDLLDRLDYDLDECLHSSAQKVAVQARREVEHLRDLALLPEIEKLLSGRLKRRHTWLLFDIIESIVTNSNSPEAKRILLGQLERQDLDGDQMSMLIHNITACSIGEASPILQRLMIGEKYWPHAHAAYRYFESLKDASAVDCIVHSAQFEKDKSFAIFALQAIGGEQAIQALKEIAEDDKDAESNMRSFIALGELGRGDPETGVFAHETLKTSKRSLKRYCIHALGLMEYTAAFPEVIAFLREVIDREDFGDYAGPKHGTQLSTCLNYFFRIGEGHNPEVVVAVSRLAKKSYWEQLSKSEQAFLTRRYGIAVEEKASPRAPADSGQPRTPATPDPRTGKRSTGLLGRLASIFGRGSG